MSSRRERVDRPLKPAEYEIRFANRDAEKGWRDVLAVATHATVEAWAHLTAHPHEGSKRCYALKAAYAVVNIGGVAYEQWQYKVTDGARIWHCVVPSNPKAKPNRRAQARCTSSSAAPGTPRAQNELMPWRRRRRLSAGDAEGGDEVFVELGPDPVAGVDVRPGERRRVVVSSEEGRGEPRVVAGEPGQGT